MNNIENKKVYLSRLSAQGAYSLNACALTIEDITTSSPPCDIQLGSILPFLQFWVIDLYSVEANP